MIEHKPFENTKIIIQRLDKIYENFWSEKETPREEIDWLDQEFPYEFAKVLRLEIPHMEKIAKMICVMDDLK